MGPSSKPPKRVCGEMDNEDDNDSIDDSGIKEMLKLLSTKMDSLNGAMSDVNNRLNMKIDGLESSLNKLVNEVKEDMDTKLSGLSVDVDNRIQNVVASMNRKCDETVAQVSSEMTNRMDELRAIHESRLDKLERSSLEKELIITGIPMEPNDNPIGIIGDICSALNCNLQQRDFTAAFRLKRKHVTSNRSVPLVIRVYDNYVKQELLASYFKRKDLNLKDIGFQTSSRIFINESLTKANREIFKLASAAKKSNLIIKLFTRNGLVHFQRNENDKPICVYHISDLEQFLPPSFEGTSSYPSQNIRRGMNNHSSMPPIPPTVPDSHVRPMDSKPTTSS